jgi:retron-type reverse transcriptase
LAQPYIAEGHHWVVDFDLEKFFDRVNHDRLLAAVAERVADKRMLKLIRAFLEAGVMENGLVSPVDEGTPQGGSLSPLLSNLVPDEVDRRGRQTPLVLQGLEKWLRRRLRAVVWKQWKHGRTRFRELRKRGVHKDLAAQTAGSPHGPDGSRILPL